MAGGIIAKHGAGGCLCSSDAPHIEGDRHPLRRFEGSLSSVSPQARRRFYSDNFIDLMGPALDADLPHPAHLHAA